jgi:hypothetical protein
VARPNSAQARARCAPRLRCSRGALSVLARGVEGIMFKTVLSMSFGAALCFMSFSAYAQTGYGVKPGAPSRSSFDRSWNHANQSKERARAGASWVRRHHASPFGF